MPVIAIWYVIFEKKCIFSQDIIGKKVLTLFQLHEFNYFLVIILFIICIRKPLLDLSCFFNAFLSMVTFLVIVSSVTWSSPLSMVRRSMCLVFGWQLCLRQEEILILIDNRHDRRWVRIEWFNCAKAWLGNYVIIVSYATVPTQKLK